MSSLARTRPTGAAPSRRLVGVVRATLYAPIAQRIEQQSSNLRVAGSSPAGRASCSTYGRMKSLQRISDAGSIPATSTTTGVLGFDGMNSCDGRPVMVPAASGSADESGVQCDGPKSQTPMTAFIGLRRQPDVPAARNGTKGRHLFNDPSVKPETAARAKRASIGTTACASGFGVAFFNGRNAQVDAQWPSCWMYVRKEHPPSHKPEIDTGPSTLSIASSNTSNVGFRRPLLAAFYAAAAGKVDPHAMACDCVARHRPGRQRGFNSRQTDATTHSRINARPAAPINAATQTIGVNRAPSLEMVIGVAAPFNAAFLAEPNPHLRKHANKHGQQTGAANMRASREKFARVAGNAQAIPASNAAPFHSARLTLRAPSPAAAGIFYLTGQHVRIVTTARNCLAARMEIAA